MEVIILLAVVVAAYFLPAIIAGARGHNNAGAIFATNLFLGWLLIGWIVALIWSFTSNTKANTVRVVEPRHPDVGVSSYEHETTALVNLWQSGSLSDDQFKQARAELDTRHGKQPVIAPQ